MPLILKKAVLGCKTEVTQGTAIALTATDYMLATEPRIDFDIESFVREHRRSSLDRLAPYIGRRNVVVTFQMEVRGDEGVAGVEIDPMSAALIASTASVATIVATTSVTYNPVSAPASASFDGPGKSCTTELYLDGVLHTVAGCVGTAKLVCTIGKIGMWEITLFGIYQDPTDTAFPAQTLNTDVGPQCLGISLSIQGFGAIVASKVEIDFVNEVEPRIDINNTTGLKGFLATGRTPVGSVDPEAELIATHPFVKNMLDATEGILTFNMGSVAGNVNTFTFDKCQYTGYVYAARNGILTADLSLSLNTNTGDDWFKYAIT